MLRHFPSIKVVLFRNFLFGVLISGIGGEGVRVATAWYLYDVSKSKILLGLLGLVGFAATLLTSQIAGVITDRFDRKMVLATSNFLLSCVVISFAILIYFDITNPSLILAFYGLASFIMAFDGIARGSIYPNLVPKEMLPNAITIQSVVFNIRKIMGPTIAGFLIAILPIAQVYIACALTFFVLAYIASNIPYVRSNQNTQESYSKSYVEGMKYVFSQKLLLSTGIMDFLIMFFASAQTILPAIVQEIYHGGSWQLGVLYSAISLGAIIPGIYLSTKHHISNLRNTLVGSVVLVSLATIAFGLAPNYIFAFLALVAFGVGDEISSIIRNNIRHIITPDHMRARMIAVISLFFVGGPRLGDFEAGLTGALWGLRPSLVINGILALVTTGIFHVYFLKIKDEFKKLEKK